MTTIILAFSLAANTFHLPPGLQSALCFVESSHNARAIHHDDGGGNSLGVCQIKITTARQLGFRGTEKDLMQPQINVYYSAAYIRYQLDRYHGSIPKAVAAYNAGKYRPGPKGAVNQKYVTKVFVAWSKNK